MINGLNIYSVDSMINISIQTIVICYQDVIHCNFQFNSTGVVNTFDPYNINLYFSLRVLY